jgi:hypothetical protein
MAGSGMGLDGFADPDAPYTPAELHDGAEEVSDRYESGTLEVFGLGPTRLDLEQTAAAKQVRRYQSRPERLDNVIAIVSRQLFIEGQPVTAHSILNNWDETTTAKPDLHFVEAYIKTDAFIQKMEAIGAIPRDGLTKEQHALISTLTNPDGKSLTMKLKKHRVPWVTFQGWLRQPKFLEYLKLNAEQALDASEAFSLIQLVNQSTRGNQKAIDTVLAMTGRWDPANRKQVDAQKMVGIILQVLDEEIADPELKARIGNRLSLLSSSATVMGEAEIGELL